jgi:hypothetical protein
MGQLAVFGNVHAAKAKDRASIAAAAEISDRRKIFFFISSSVADSDVGRLARCGDDSDT